MSLFLPDTSCMVAALSSWHERHQSALSEINGRRDRGDEMVVAAPALVETYSVLTRLPSGQRIAAAVALAAIEASFVGPAREVVALAAADYRALLGRAPAGRVTGGRIYDAVIAACAELAGVATLLTFNVAHFQDLVGPRVSVVAPDG